MKRFVIIALTLMLPLALAGSAPWTAAAAAVVFTHDHALDNGTLIRIYPPEEILGRLTFRDGEGRLVFRPEGGGEYLLVEDIDDPLIANTGDGVFHPMEEEAVLDALRAIDVGDRILGMEVDIYLLPLPRREILSSSTSSGRIFLSPGVRPWRVEVTALIVTHEFGHCYQQRYLPMSETQDWTDYLDLRGILDDPVYSESAAHMYRPSEVFAEDFRALFGGAASCYSGTIENPDLAHPAAVAGLGDWISGLAGGAVADYGAALPVELTASSYPNPFNPSTTISATLGADDRARSVDVRIYAADGSIVRDLYSGTAPHREFSVTWDGRVDGGGRAASGVYFYRIRCEGSSFTGKMLMLR